MATINLGRVGFVNKGAHNIATAYKVNDVVTYNSGTYACIQAHTGQLPTVTAYWQNWVANDKALDSSVVHKTGDETITGVKTFSSNTIFNGNVGIGTSSPTAKLEVAGGFNVSTLGSFPSLISSGGYGGGIGLFDTNGYVGMYSSGGAQELNFFTNANNSNTVSSSTKMILDTAGNLLLKSGTGGLGYGTGSGGTVTQLTSKSTAVTLNKPTGSITMNNAALAAGSSVQFTVNNSLVTASDTVLPSLKYSIYYELVLVDVQNGTFTLRLKNTSGGTLSDAVPINFSIIKGANA